jgi:hypothetical protein
MIRPRSTPAQKEQQTATKRRVLRTKNEKDMHNPTILLCPSFLFLFSTAYAARCHSTLTAQFDGLFGQHVQPRGRTR